MPASPGAMAAQTDVELTTAVSKGRKYEYPSCRLCEQGWSWPRNLRYVHVNTDAVTIHPRTKNTVVPYLGHNPKTGAPLFPPELFNQLHIVFSTKFMHNALVTEFTYDKKTGTVYYENLNETDQLGGMGYARQITLSAWWRDLARAILGVTINIADITSNLLFLVQQFSKTAEEANRNITLFIAFAWTSTVGFWVYLAVAEASKEWRLRAHPNIGDISRLPGRVDEWLSFGALSLFFFAGIETLTRDIVIFLHPWKGFMPFAAWKTHGTRAFVIGFKDCAWFKMENNQGQIYILPLRVVATMLLFTFKLLLLVNEHRAEHTTNVCDDGSNLPFMLASLSTSIASMSVNFRKWNRLRLARREWRVRQKAEKAKQEAETQHKEKGLDTNWRDTVFEQQHFGSGRNICAKLRAALSHCGDALRCRGKEEQCQTDGCIYCGRVPATKELISKRETASTHAPLDCVMLTKDYKNYSDAKHGILKPGDLGIVLQRSEFVAGYGQRVLVRTKDPKRTASLEEFMHTWWYDACALRIASHADKFDLDAKHKLDGASIHRVHEFADEVKAAGAKLRREVADFADETARKEAISIITGAMKEALGGLLGQIDLDLYQVSSKQWQGSLGEGVSSPQHDLSFLSQQGGELTRGGPSFLLSPKGASVEKMDAAVQCELVPFQMLPAAVTEETDGQQLGEDDARESLGRPATPREAQMRLMLENMTRPPPSNTPRNFKALRHKVLHVAGRKRCGLAILGGQTIRRAETALLLKQLGERVSTDLASKVVLVTASMQGVEQKFRAYCNPSVEHCHLTMQKDVVHYTRNHDFVAGDNINDLREALVNVADVFVVVEGAKECAEDAQAAFDRGGRIIPVKKYGGAGSGRHGFPIEALSKPDWADESDWDHLSDGLNPQATADAVINLLVQAMPPRTSRGKETQHSGDSKNEDLTI